MSDDDLSKLLHEWKPQVSASEGFRRNVWTRIETAQAHTDTWWQHIFGILARPRVAMAALAVVLLAGSVIGSGVASSQEEAAYLQSVNPYARIIRN